MIGHIQYITQDHPTLSHNDLCLQACDAGVNWVQLRMKNVPPEVLLETAHNCREITRRFGAKLIINDHLEIALSSNADGVHLGQQDQSTHAARQRVPSGFIIGGTANTLDEIITHVRNGVDYVGVGPYRFTTTKKALSPLLGLDGYREIIQGLKANEIDIPVIAIGGIEVADVNQIIGTGVYGIAVSGLISLAEDKYEIIQTLNKQLHHATT